MSNDDAKDALRILLKWIGEIRKRALRDTEESSKAYKEWFAGYNHDPAEILSKTFRK